MKLTFYLKEICLSELPVSSLYLKFFYFLVKYNYCKYHTGCANSNETVKYRENRFLEIFNHFRTLYTLCILHIKDIVKDVGKELNVNNCIFSKKRKYF